MVEVAALPDCGGTAEGFDLPVTAAGAAEALREQSL